MNRYPTGTLTEDPACFTYDFPPEDGPDPPTDARWPDPEPDATRLETIPWWDVPDALYDHLEQIAGLVMSASLHYRLDVRRGEHHPELIDAPLAEAVTRLGLLMAGATITTEESP